MSDWNDVTARTDQVYLKAFSASSYFLYYKCLLENNHDIHDFVLPKDLFSVFSSPGYMCCLYPSREEHHKVFCFVLILNLKQSIYNKAFPFPTKPGAVYIAPFNLKVPVKVSKVC